MNTGILGMGSHAPERIVSNLELEKIMDTSDEWIQSRTGIAERRIASEDVSTSDMAYWAAREALDRSGVDAADLGIILVATVTPDYAFPSVACQIQDRLGAGQAAAMDVSAACSGFIYSMITAKQFIDNGIYQNILVVGSEKLSNAIDWSDRSTAILFGDGAGAAVMGSVPESKGILSFELGADGSGGPDLYQDDFIKMNGSEVFKFAVRQMQDTALNVIDKAGLEKKDVDFLVPHQANFRIMEAARQRLELPEEKVSMTVRNYGNTSSASIPIAFVEALDQGKIKDGDLVVLIGFGGGLTWGGIALRWGTSYTG